MNEIKILSQDLINIIAAGEVVERPASVVKELMENSIDAKSSIIKVNIEDYGKKLIEVIDNGDGMNKDDAILSLEQHSTSKIQNLEDVENITTLGFRGEALASITSVAQSSELETKREDSEATLVKIEKNRKSTKTSTKSEKGTRISVYNLFENVPARKKFLKSDATEFRNILNTFIDIALINTELHFEIYHNGKIIYKLSKCSSILDRVFDIWGKQAQTQFYEEREVETDLGKIKLILEKPENTKKKSNFQYIYINGRRVDNKAIQSAVKEGYHGFIHKDLRPSFIAVIHMDFSKVDVNVHPRKLEVRFEDPQNVFRSVYHATKKILEKETKEVLTSRIEDYQNQQYEKPTDNFINDLNLNKSTPFTQKSNYSTSNRFSKVQDAISFTRDILPQYNFNSNNNYEEKNSYKPFQLFNTYIVYENNESLIFIDQHAAAEKINFEKLLYSLGEVKTKPLLVPTIINLKHHEKDLILENKSSLNELGVVIEDFGGATIQVSEIPESLSNFNFESYLNEILNNEEDFSWIKTEYIDTNLSREMYALLALTACHGSIRAGKQLTEIEMKQIITDLNKLKQPNNCPHGRPISWTISKQNIEKNFKRII